MNFWALFSSSELQGEVEPVLWHRANHTGISQSEVKVKISSANCQSVKHRRLIEDSQRLQVKLESVNVPQ